jgi:hypothetical protein
MTAGNTITGIVGQIILSGATISGTGNKAMEATIQIARAHAEFLPVGTSVKEIISGMKSASGTVRAAWVTGGTLMRTLMDGDTTFEMSIQLTGAVALFASGCKADSYSVRIAPSTEVLTEELAFTGTDWY